MKSRLEGDQLPITLFACGFGNSNLNRQAKVSIRKFLTSIGLDLSQVENFGLRARRICEEEGQKVPEGLPSNLAGLFLCARELCREDSKRGEEAMMFFRQTYDNLPAGVTVVLKPGIAIIQRKVPFLPVDLKRVGNALAFPGETGHLGHSYEPTKRW